MIPEVEVCLPLRSYDARSVLDVAARVHDLGVAGVWVSELASYDAVAVAAASLHRWPTLRVGTAIVPVGTRTNASLALSAATLGALGGHRAVLGLGVSTQSVIEGWHHVTWDGPVRRLHDAYTAVSALLDGRPTENGMRIETVRARPRIYLAALGPRMTALACEVADGLLLNLTPITALGDPAGSEVIPAFETCLPVRIAVHSDRTSLEHSLERQRRELASYLSVDVYARAYRQWGWGDVVDRVEQSRGGPGAAAAVPDALVHDVAIMGDVEYCQGRLEAIRAAGVTPLLVPIVPPADADAFVDVVEAILPST